MALQNRLRTELQYLWQRSGHIGICYNDPSTNLHTETTTTNRKISHG